jgi:cob(I)alamin adenosyltransferase
MGLILVTHDVELAALIADRVIILSQGEVIASGPTGQVLSGSPLFAPQITRLFPGRWWLIDRLNYCGDKMPRLTKIYTRQGDEGNTKLSGGQLVSKDSCRVAAYGSVDELNSQIGVALSFGLTDRLAEILPVIQNELFHLGSDLSFLEEDKDRIAIPHIEAHHVKRLEILIDEMVEVIGPLKNFILPGGSPGAAQLHVARTVCRRAERDVITLSRLEPVGSFVISYLNRLSDVLFVMSRYENFQQGIAESLWNSQL